MLRNNPRSTFPVIYLQVSLPDLSQLPISGKEGSGGAMVELKLNTHMNLLNPDCVKGWRSGSGVVRG